MNTATLLHGSFRVGRFKHTTSKRAVNVACHVGNINGESSFFFTRDGAPVFIPSNELLNDWEQIEEHKGMWSTIRPCSKRTFSQVKTLGQVMESSAPVKREKLSLKKKELV